MKFSLGTLILCAGVAGFTMSASADEISMAANSTGKNLNFLRARMAEFEQKTGHIVKLVTMPPSSSEQFSQYRLWLAAGNTDVDVYQTDIVWAPQLSEQFVDLTEATKDVIGEHFPSVVASQTVDGKLVAMPMYTDAPALFYRTDLLEKYGKRPPKTWAEMGETAKEIQGKERADGKKDLWGFVFQGSAYEGLTCNALEWIASSGGGRIVEEDGEISINNAKAIAAIDMVKGWIGTITPQGALAYKEEESRGVFQTGNAVFMRNWPYAYALGNGADSAIKGKFAVMALPSGVEGQPPSSALGGWNVAVSKYSGKQQAAIELVKFLTSAETQKKRAIELSNLPTVSALYDDADVAKAQPFMPTWKPIFESAVPRPSAATKVKYNEVSSKIWGAVHNTLSGSGTAAENLELLELELTEVRGDSW
jgi:trehalose/maltose transport system substrate-binding protein